MVINCKHCQSDRLEIFNHGEYTEHDIHIQYYTCGNCMETDYFERFDTYEITKGVKQLIINHELSPFILERILQDYEPALTGEYLIFKTATDEPLILLYEHGHIVFSTNHETLKALKHLQNIMNESQGL